MCAQFPPVHRWRIGISGGSGDIAWQRGTAQLHAKVRQHSLSGWHFVVSVHTCAVSRAWNSTRLCELLCCTVVQVERTARNCQEGTEILATLDKRGGGGDMSALLVC